MTLDLVIIVERETLQAKGEGEPVYERNIGRWRDISSREISP
jgi:hypothetical protein